MRRIEAGAEVLEGQLVVQAADVREHVSTWAQDTSVVVQTSCRLRGQAHISLLLGDRRAEEHGGLA